MTMNKVTEGWYFSFVFLCFYFSLFYFLSFYINNSHFFPPIGFWFEDFKRLTLDAADLQTKVKYICCLHTSHKGICIYLESFKVQIVAAKLNT